MNGDKTVYGEYITYRLRNTTPATISLWSEGGGTRAGEPVQLMKDIDLVDRNTRAQIDYLHQINLADHFEFRDLIL